MSLWLLPVLFWWLFLLSQTTRGVKLGCGQIREFKQHYVWYDDKESRDSRTFREHGMSNGVAYYGIEIELRVNAWDFGLTHGKPKQLGMLDHNVRLRLRKSSMPKFRCTNTDVTTMVLSGYRPAFPCR